jgi:hypothetical protein
VAFGTGVGFAASKPIHTQATRFELSLEKVGCFSDTSAGTAAGLYNFYGEGQPAYVELSDHGHDIYSLKPAAGVAGRGGLIPD